jgi:hypothetical protein
MGLSHRLAPTCVEITYGLAIVIFKFSVSPLLG